MSKKLKRQLLLAAGTLSLAIGIVGIFVPILPTTPFLLLAAGCYLRSSQRFYNWLMGNRFFGNYIRNYIEGRGIPVKVKLFIIILLWVTIGISIWLVAKPLVTVILLIVAVGVTLHIIFICVPQCMNDVIIFIFRPPHSIAVFVLFPFVLLKLSYCIHTPLIYNYGFLLQPLNAMQYTVFALTRAQSINAIVL